jgi:glycosyltransferase involved in cell wall biosynthesis
MRFVITRRESIDAADGISAFIFSLSDALMRHGDEVLLVTPSYSSLERIRERFGSPAFTSAHYLCSNPKPTHKEMILAWWKHGLPLLRRLKPDFIIMTGALPMRLPQPSCIISHDLEKRWSYGSLVRQMYKIYCYRNVDRIIATCSELREALAKELFMSADNISLIPTCIDIRTYRHSPLEAREAAILHVGTSEWKNPAATIDAFARLRQPASLYIIGNVTAEIEERLALLPETVRRRVSLLGIVDSKRLKELLSMVRILSVPSVYAVPVASPTALDGLASGTPVVGSMSISADLLTDGHTGFRIDTRDTQKLADKFDLLLRDNSLWQTISGACSRRSEGFSSEEVVQKFVDLAASCSRGKVDDEAAANVG